MINGDVSSKRTIHLSDDGEFEMDNTAPVFRYEKRKRRQKRWWVAALIAALIVIGFFVGYSTRLHIPTTGRLAYSALEGGNARIVDLQTGQEEYAPIALDPRRPTVSPDGKSSAYWLNTGNNINELWLSRVNATERSKLGEFRIIYATLAWSPDSTQLAFAASDPQDADHAFETEELYILNVLTGQVRQITHNNVRDDAPSWSPDGKQIVFTSAEDGYNRLNIIDLASGQRHIVSKECFGYAPVWSLDGASIAFVSDHEGFSVGQQVYVINADGSNLRRLTSSKSYKEFVAWIP